MKILRSRNPHSSRTKDTTTSPTDEGAASEGRSEPSLDTRRQDRYRKVFTRRGMRNADNQSVHGTSSATRQKRIAVRTRLQTIVQQEPLPRCLRKDLSERWRSDARRHRRNAR